MGDHSPLALRLHASINEIFRRTSSRPGEFASQNRFLIDSVSALKGKKLQLERDIGKTYNNYTEFYSHRELVLYRGFNSVVDLINWACIIITYFGNNYKLRQ